MGMRIIGPKMLSSPKCKGLYEPCKLTNKKHNDKIKKDVIKVRIT
jgi:hypothetical protein